MTNQTVPVREVIVLTPTIVCTAEITVLPDKSLLPVCGGGLNLNVAIATHAVQNVRQVFARRRNTHPVIFAVPVFTVITRARPNRNTTGGASTNFFLFFGH
jgi:hypothetical protein